MEQLIQVIIDNGLGVASFLFMVFYILTDKKQVAEEKNKNNDFMQSLVKSLDNNTDTLKVVNDNQKEMLTTLEKMNYRIETIEEKINKKEG